MTNALSGKHTIYTDLKVVGEIQSVKTSVSQNDSLYALTIITYLPF